MRKHTSCVVMGLLCVLILAACGLGSAAVAGSAPAEPARASVAPSVPGPATAEANDTLHITWLYDDMGDPRESQQHLDILQDVLNRGGWKVKLDLLPERYRRDLNGFATDAYMTPPSWEIVDIPLPWADPDKLLDSGATMDVLPLCAQYAPVLAEKNADLLTPAGVPMAIQRNVNKSGLYLHLLRGAAPQQWLAAPPKMSEIVSWLENGGVSLGQPVPESSSPVPFPTALQAWAAEQGYYPLDIFFIYGGFYAKIGDAAMQPVPMESIQGFDAMYRRLFALYEDGTYFEGDTRPIDTVGYLGNRREVREEFLQARNTTAADMVVIPVWGAAWEKSEPVSPGSNLLAIPQNSRHVQRVLELAQWALTTREGYDLVRYGILGEDYTLQDDLLQWTENSKMENLHYWFAYDDAMERLNQPANAADIDKVMTYVKLPSLNLDVEYDKTQYAGPLQAIIQPVWDANAKLVGDRMALLMGKQPAAEGWGTKPVTSADAAFEMLDVLKPQTAELAQAYAAELAKLQPK